MIARSPAPRRRPLLAGVLLLTGLTALRAEPAQAHCGCKRTKTPRCADAAATRRVTVDIDLQVLDGTVEVITQSGPYRMPAGDLDGKRVLFIFLPRGETFQGFFETVIPGSITIGPMTGPQARITTGAVFAPGEYEMLLFVDVVPDGALAPQRGDLAAFDNGVCDPTGVSIRVAVGCEDTTVHLTNRHFIIF